MAQSLYREAGLACLLQRIHPGVPHAAGERCPTDPKREFRLYQADFLLRRYGFSTEELLFDAQGRLMKPWIPRLPGHAHPERFP
jgi:predicted DNA-binding helix-hairpin-helix protein